MKSRILFTVLIASISFSANTIIDPEKEPLTNGFQSSKIPLEWLTGDQPQLLTSMANSISKRETLSGDSKNLTAIVGGWHAQAIGQYKDYVYVAFSDGSLGKGEAKVGSKNPVGKLWIYNTKTKQSQLKNLESGYPHPCSIQVTGKYLTIVIEAEYGLSQAALGNKRDEQSLVLIYDLEQDPNCSIEVGRISQENTNSGGAGLAWSPKTKCWYMLVDQDSKDGKVVVYKTANEKLDSWQKQPIAKYRRYGSGAGLNLLTASDNSIWGLYYENTEIEKHSFANYDITEDKVRLFKLIEPNGTPVARRTVFTQTVNISTPRIKAVGELLANRPGMRFGAGLRYENGVLELLTCQRNMNKSFNIDRNTLLGGKRTQAVFMNLAKAKGEIYLSSLSNSTQNHNLKKNQSESGAMVLQPPVKGDVNYFSEKSISSSGFGGLSSLKKSAQWTDAFEAHSSAPLVLFYLEGLTDVQGQMIEYYTTKTSDNKIN
ncbi:hypothetical protein [Ekhidna sp. To15]|uniref:hypothetical protein n=1 Tax=Ekhidna sp. To15 TaxID=3395267 RepID=UPI003F523CD2